MTVRARKIPEYGDKYLLREDGTLYRMTDDGYVTVSQHGDPPRVRLYRLGKVYHVYVHVLVNEVFGDE